MKKSKRTVAAVILSCSLMFSSCIGSFSLTNKLLGWNGNVSSKFFNELVFVAFHIVPVYEVSVLADILVLNSIEFWTGSSPVADNTKYIQGENGQYLVVTDENGYTITNEADNTTISFVFDKADNSWSLNANGETTKFMTFVDDNHVKMYNPAGEDMIVELSQAGVMAYQEVAQHVNLALK